jgi:hypothetical protein
VSLLFTGVFMVALVGLIATFRIVIARATRVSADLSGLHSQTGSKNFYFTWEAIQRMEVALDSDGDHSFRARASDDQTIPWSADNEQHFNPKPGTFRVTAAELAAIVVQCSGKPLTVAQE